MIRPPRPARPTSWRTSGTIKAQSLSRTEGFAATYTEADEDNVPMSIDPVGSSSRLSFGLGLVHRGEETHNAIMPASKADGTARSVPQGTRIVADGETYEASAPGVSYPSGILVVPVIKEA